MEPSIPTLYQTPISIKTAMPSGVPVALVRLSAGFPSPAADYSEDPLDLNEYLIERKEATFMFTVSGDSMQLAGILDGDKVVVDRSITPQHGQIVVAVYNGEFTIKRLFMRGGRVELRPDNPKYRPIILRDGNELQVWGVVRAVVRRC
ncbi:LexA family protein (plasmid) [Ampullimonas aquatilis]|uniref:LexA family protein n=1 Tax=Ampullimonas aquatilis TaxID=1341549 RepID=UPI003C72C0A2